MKLIKRSDKSRGVSLALAAVLGWAGAHRFYVGKVGTGLLMFLTMGGLGVWWTYDLILVAAGAFRDFRGLPVTEWGPEGTASERFINEEILEELDALRADMADLMERQEFTERLLAGGDAPPAEDTQRTGDASWPSVRP